MDTPSLNVASDATAQMDAPKPITSPLLMVRETSLTAQGLPKI
jgi:hypothetical protein